MSAPSTPDAFDLLGLEPTFELTSQAITRAYLAKVSELHPDRHGGDELRSALLNRAKQTLEDREQRAALLLVRLGGSAKENDRTLPEGFLEQMLSVREELESAGTSGDAASHQKLSAWAEEEREKHIARISSLFRESGGTPASLAAIRRELNAWRYIERMIEQLDDQ